MNVPIAIRRECFIDLTYLMDASSSLTLVSNSDLFKLGAAVTPFN